MRKIMRESLYLLLTSGEGEELDRLVPNWSENTDFSFLEDSLDFNNSEILGTRYPGLSYADFSSLRPEVPASSWRGMMNQLVARRLVVKRSVRAQQLSNIESGDDSAVAAKEDGQSRSTRRVVFQLSRLGEEWLLQNAFTNLLGGRQPEFGNLTPFSGGQTGSERSRSVVGQPAAERKLSLVLLKPATTTLSGKGDKKTRPNYKQAKKILSAAGYDSLIPGVYLSQSGGYSDVLWKSLEESGFISVFIRVPAQAMKPMSLSQLAQLTGSFDEEMILQGKYQQIITQIEQLLNKLTKTKKLSPSHKKQIGELVVSGLTLITQWRPLWSEHSLSRADVQRLLVGVFLLMRQYKRI